MIKRFLKPGFLVVMGVTLYLIAANSGAGWMYVVSAALGATLLVSLLASLFNVRGIGVERHNSMAGTAGEPLDSKMEIRNEGRFARHLLELSDDFAGGTGKSVLVRVEGRASESVEYTIENPRRGVYAGGEIVLESAAPFGFFYGRRKMRVGSEAVIYPRTFQVAGLSNLPIPESERSERDESDALHRGSGGDFWGVREYRPGDPAKLVSWRRSARNLSAGRLAVLEMSQETRPPVSLALDLDARAPREALEMQISAAASITLQALREGRAVFADTGPRNPAFPETGDPDAVLAWFAGLTASHPPAAEETAVQIRPSLNGMRPTGAETVVLISCHEFAGSGPWMTPDEELAFVERTEAGGRRVVRLGPDVREPWRLA